MNKSADRHSEVDPKQKHLIHSSGFLASSLNVPFGHIFGPFITTKIVSGIAKIDPRILMASQE